MKYDGTILYISNDSGADKVYCDFFREKFTTVIEAGNGRECQSLLPTALILL